MENSNAIAQVQEPLQKSLMMTISGPKKPQLQPSFNLKQIQRSVDHLIKRLPSNFSQLQLGQSPELDKNNQPQVRQVPEHAPKDLILSRYNYTGKSYRYEQAESLTKVCKPEVKQTSRTELDLVKKKEDSWSMKNEVSSCLAVQSFDGSQVKFPTHNYYIVFDKQQKKKQLNRNTADTQSYFLQKKVHRLEEQLKSLKISQTAQSFHPKKEGKMRLQKLLDSIIG